MKILKIKNYTKYAKIAGFARIRKKLYNRFGFEMAGILKKNTLLCKQGEKLKLITPTTTKKNSYFNVIKNSQPINLPSLYINSSNEEIKHYMAKPYFESEECPLVEYSEDLTPHSSDLTIMAYSKKEIECLLLKSFEDQNIIATIETGEDILLDSSILDMDFISDRIKIIEEEIIDDTILTDITD